MTMSPLLKKLHWLRVAEGIFFKRATLSFRYLDGSLPPYLSCCLSSYSPSTTLPSYCHKLKIVSGVNLNSTGARSVSSCLEFAANEYSSLLVCVIL